MSNPTSTLSSDIKAAFDAAFAEQAEGEQGNMQTLSDAIAAAIDKHIKSHNATGSDSGGDSHNLTVE